MSLFNKAESFLQASGYDVVPHESERDFLVARKPDLGGDSSITCLGVVERPQEPSEQYQIESRFERMAREHPSATLKLLSMTGTGGYQAHVTDNLRRSLNVKILPPAFFFDTLFKYDNDGSVASTVKDLADSGKKQEPLRVKQPYRLESGDQGDDLAEYLLDRVEAADYSRSPSLWIVSAPAGFGKSFMFASLFHKVYQVFQNKKRAQQQFPRPLPMIAEHLRSSAGPNIRGLINAFVQTDFAGNAPPELFTWMIDNGHGFWMTDGLDEVITGDDQFLEFIMERLTQPSSSTPLMLMSLRDSLLRSKEGLHELIEIGGDLVERIELLPWDRPQKRSFAWTKVHKKLPTPEDRDDPEVTNLIGGLTKNETTNKLTSTPFYADMLAEAFLEDSPLSPQNEFELLDLAVFRMCRREYEKGGPIQESVLPPEAFRDWLEELAGEVVTQSGISLDELRTFSELVLVLTTTGETPNSTDQLVDQMMVMPFLKNSPVSGKFEFTHEILGEFLAGSFFSNQMESAGGGNYLEQELPSDSMLLKVIAWKFRRKRNELVKAIQTLPSSATPGTVHRNIVQVLGLMENGRELLDQTGLSLENADLSGVQFGSMDLHKVRFFASDLGSADLSKCNLRDARFESARLRETKLPSRSSQFLKGATFDSMNFDSICPLNERRIDSNDRFLSWAEDATDVAIRRDLPCPSALQLAHLFGKFVWPTGEARRNWIDERAVFRGKQIQGGPGYKATVDKVIEFRYLQKTQKATRRGVSRPRGALYSEIVQFRSNETLSSGLRKLLGSLCRRPNCPHVKS